MSYSETLDENYAPDADLSLTPDIKNFLAEAARWAKFIAIVGFVTLGLMVIAAFSIGSIMSMTMAQLSDEIPMGFPPMLFTGIYLIAAIISFFPIYYLYKFASNMQLALKRDDHMALTESFRNLKAHYKFYGILIAIFLGFYALLIVIGIGSALMV